MNEKTEIRSVELVRKIRDEQARQLSGKSNVEIIAFFRQAGEKARQYAQQLHVQKTAPTQKS